MIVILITCIRYALHIPFNTCWRYVNACTRVCSESRSPVLVIDLREPSSPSLRPPRALLHIVQRLGNNTLTIWCKTRKDDDVIAAAGDFGELMCTGVSVCLFTLHTYFPSRLPNIPTNLMTDPISNLHKEP